MFQVLYTSCTPGRACGQFKYRPARVISAGVKDCTTMTGSLQWEGERMEGS